MKKSIFIFMALVLGMVACSDLDEEMIQQQPLDDLTIEEQDVVDKLISIGLSEDVSNQIIADVVRPQKTLTSTFNSPVATIGIGSGGGGGGLGWFKNGVYTLLSGPGPGESGGPINDKCTKPGKKCRVSNSVHVMTPVEMNTFFPGGLGEFYSIVGPEGAYDESHPYVDYLSIIFND